MKLYKVFAACVLMFASVTFADSVNAVVAAPAPKVTASADSQASSLEPRTSSVSASSDIMFSKVYLSIEGGRIYPLGDMLDAVEDTWFAGLGIRYAYWENVEGLLDFDFTYFKMKPDSIYFPGVFQFMGRLGLDWHSRVIKPVVVGAGFTCNWTRADGGKEELYNERGGTLNDNETEFGIFAHINVPLLVYDRIRTYLNVQWEELWTLPKRSDMLYAGVIFEWRVK